MKEGQVLRLFVAAELPPEARRALHQTLERLKAAITGPLRWVGIDGVHLTLKFLGDVPVQQASEIGDRLARAVSGCAPFELQLSEVGTFPNGRAPRVVWVGLEGGLEALAGVQHAVEEAAAELGFPKETRQFTPHLTLARVRHPLTREEGEHLTATLQSIEVSEGPAFRVGSVSLIRSTLTPSGAVYEILKEWPLGT